MKQAISFGVVLSCLFIFGACGNGDNGFGFVPNNAQPNHTPNPNPGSTPTPTPTATPTATPTPTPFVGYDINNPGTEGALFGSSVAGPGDVDDDGFNDILVGTLNQGVFVFSGFDGSLLHAITPTQQNSYFAYRVAGAGDLNDDGHADFLVTAQGGDGFSDGIQVYDGATYERIRVISEPSLGVYALDIAGGGDVTGDGIPDVIAGSYPQHTAENALAGKIYVFSGADILSDAADIAPVLTIEGTEFYEGIGYRVADAGDVDGDGHADILSGAIWKNNQKGAVAVYSGADGHKFYEISGEHEGYWAAGYGWVHGDFLGGSVASVGDVDGDGHPDFVAGAYSYDPTPDILATGRVYVVSGFTGTILYTIDGENDGDRLGLSSAGLGDYDGNGTPDMAIAAVTADPAGLSNAGSILIFDATDGTLIRRIDGIAAGGRLGDGLAGAGDVNGDGLGNVIIAAPYVNGLQGSVWVR